VTTTYSYNTGGDLWTVSYSDGTPGLTDNYDHRGRVASVIHTNRTVSWTYNDADRPLTETNSGGTLSGWSVVNEYSKLLRTHQRLREGGATRQESRFGALTLGDPDSGEVIVFNR
jgi:YD repeat-containing protein